MNSPHAAVLENWNSRPQRSPRRLTVELVFTMTALSCAGCA
jgi:hypothetical protein